MGICDLRNGTSKKLADLRGQNENNNLRICDLRASKNVFMPTSFIDIRFIFLFILCP
jgi:hypothetical protein